jgi:hypothetical protein
MLVRIMKKMAIPKKIGYLLKDKWLLCVLQQIKGYFRKKKKYILKRKVLAYKMHFASFGMNLAYVKNYDSML